MVAGRDWDGVALAAAGFGRESRGGRPDDDDDTTGSGGMDGRVGGTTAAGVVGADRTARAKGSRERGEARAEVERLVRRVLPDEVGECTPSARIRISLAFAVVV